MIAVKNYEIRKKMKGKKCIQATKCYVDYFLYYYLYGKFSDENDLQTSENHLIFCDSHARKDHL